MIHSSFDVKSWQQATPPIDAVRPARCSRCGCAAHPLGKPFNIVGHGLRERQILGPLGPDSGAEFHEIQVRRFYCRVCKTTLTVVPQGVVANRHYGAYAIALAFYLFGILRSTVTAVRQRISPHRTVEIGWVTWRRWMAAAFNGKLFSPHIRAASAALNSRKRAERVALTLMTLDPNSTNPTMVQLFLGAALAS